jgi:hypothetical protein
MNHDVALIHIGFGAVDDDLLYRGAVNPSPAAMPGVAPGATRSMSGSDGLIRMQAAK